MTNFSDIESNSRRLWGQSKPVSDGKDSPSKRWAPKPNVEDAKKIIVKGEAINKFCDISVQLSSLKNMMELAEELDIRYRNLVSADKSDGRKLSHTLKEA